MYLVKTPKFIQKLFPNYTWKVKTDSPTIYLTFDDGPIPGITPWVLEQLDAYNAKATFFCVGSNVEKYPEVFNQVIESGHTIGSHTMNHLNGWETDNIPYFHNVRRGASLVKSEIFRPPYGKMKPSQVQFIQRHYKVVMWDVLSGDFDPTISNDQCYRNVVNHAEAGSVIVFHDSIKAKEKLENVLPRVLEYFSGLGYQFKNLDHLINEKAVRKQVKRTA